MSLTPVNIFNRAWVICLFVAICRFIRVIRTKRRFLTGSRLFGLWYQYFLPQ
jgi:hypothetical protein